jgi:hypothetical protein
MRKTGDVRASLFFIFLGIGVIVRAIGLPIGTVSEPQPGFFPLLVGIFITVLSGLLLIHAWVGDSTGTEAFGRLWRPAILILGMVVYTLILDFIGYIIATIILSAIILCVLDTKNGWVLAGVSLAMSTGSYFLFNRMLDSPLPAGILKGLM